MNRLAKCFVLVIVLLLAVCPAWAEESTYDVIATVNGESIYQYELIGVIESISDAMVQAGYDTEDEDVAGVIEQAALDQLIDDRLIVQDMTAKGCYDISAEEESQLLEVSKMAYEVTLQQYTTYFGQQLDDPAEAQEKAKVYLQGSGYSEADYFNYYCNNLASARYEELLMQGETPQTDEELYAEQVDAKIAEQIERLREQAEIIYM